MNSNHKTQRILAVAITCVASWGFSFFATDVLELYAYGLFIWLPLIAGAVSTMIAGFRNDVGSKTLRNTSLVTLLVFCLGQLLFAWEGIICMVMAAPMGLLFTYLGHRIGYRVLRGKANNIPAAILLLLCSVPAMMAFEGVGRDDGGLRQVVTSVEIAAPPEEVWKNVVVFPQLKEPTEFIFRTGIAYPINATINGQGVGAVRHCNFSTGSFVEPIARWDEPRLLSFSVTEQPEPMKELSPYNIHPNHLHGYWVSKKGQFRLTALANGNTLLEGTTWYLNKIQPGFYWTLWSDYIVHKIHNRVLLHIKGQAEGGSPVADLRS